MATQKFAARAATLFLICLVSSAALALPGDINDDGDISVSDVQCIVLSTMAMSPDSWPECLSSVKVADIDCSGDVTVLDVQMSAKIALGDLNGSSGLSQAVDNDQDNVHNACDINPNYFDPEQADRDTLATLGCDQGQSAKWSTEAEKWTCADDVDTWLSESEVLGMVANVGYLTSELDPQFNGSAAKGITEENKGHWSAAYGWGNHADENYLKAELDPAVGAVNEGGWCRGVGGKVDCVQELPVDPDTTLNEAQVDGMVQNNGYALDTELSLAAKTGFYSDLLGAPWIQSDGALEHTGGTGILGANSNYNVWLGGIDENPDYGLVSVGNANGEPRATLYVTDASVGVTQLLGANGKTNIALWYYGDKPDHGVIDLYDDNDIARASFYASTDNAGGLNLFGANGNQNISLLYFADKPDHGALQIYGDEGTTRASLYAAEVNSGALTLFGGNGTKNATIWSYDGQPDRGALQLYDASEGTRVRLDMLDDNQGSLRLYGPNNNMNAALWGYSTSPNKGALLLYNENESARVQADILSGEQGSLRLFGANGTMNVAMWAYNTRPDVGAIQIYDANEATRVRMDVSSSTGYGTVSTSGPNGNYNVYIGASSNLDHGALSVQDSAGISQAGMYVDDSGNGLIYADVKNFRAVHPENPEQEIWYACVEGPEAAAYLRGTARLVGGQVRVAFPDHFRLMAAEEGMTVMVTPRSADSEGLAVVTQDNSGFTVQELRRGTGTYDFSWEVKAVRRGYENYQVIRPRMQMVPPQPAVDTAGG